MNLYLFDENGIGCMSEDGNVEEISSLEIDLLTILSRIHQARDLIVMIDPTTAGRIVTCDAPRLAGYLSSAAMRYCQDVELDTDFTAWLIELRQQMRKS